jgi:hypothetical protein
MLWSRFLCNHTISYNAINNKAVKLTNNSSSIYYYKQTKDPILNIMLSILYSWHHDLNLTDIPRKLKKIFFWRNKNKRKDFLLENVESDACFINPITTHIP